MDVPAGPGLRAGRVGRPHGLDGSFHVLEPEPRLLALETPVRVGDVTTVVVRRAGTDARPLVRLAAFAHRSAVEPLRDAILRVARADAPALEDGEWWAEDLVGATVRAGERDLGAVRRLVALPSVDALELDDGTMIPMVRDAILRIDPAERRIDVSEEFLGAA